jgi:hypothetical protein
MKSPGQWLRKPDSGNARKQRRSFLRFNGDSGQLNKNLLEGFG